jgi:hypothetical protein
MILIILFFAMFATPAIATDWQAAQDYVAWGDCNNDYCLMTRQAWAENYANAITGQYEGQRNVSFCMSTGCEGAIKINKILGCAWRVVILESGHLSADSSDTANLQYYCGREHIDQTEQAAARAQARTLMQMIRK